jgi:hypothetical protein
LLALFDLQRLDQLVKERRDAVGEFALDLTGPGTIGDLRLATGDEFLEVRDKEFVHHPSPYAE